MRSTLLTTLFFLSLSTLSQGQTNKYFAFPDSGAQWNQNYANGSFNGIYYYRSDEGYAYKQTHDTIINSLRYHLINVGQRWFTDTIYGNPDMTSEGNIYSAFDTLAFAIREDSLHRIFVRFILSNDSPYILNDSDYLLYDFNSKPGDIIYNSFIYYDDRGYAVVNGYDSVLVGNSYRKAIKLTLDSYIPPGSDELVEGIGSLNFGLIGPFDPSVFLVQNGNYYTNNLDCFSINNQTLLTPHYGCDSLTSINPVQAPTSTLQIYPNPTTDKLFINFVNTHSVFQLSVYNAAGQQVILPFNITTTKTVDVSNLPAGLYLIKATDNASVLTDVFVKE